MTTAEPLRLPAALLREICRVLLPGYGVARREPERMGVLTTACLERGAANGHLQRPADTTLFITDTENASDVLCALWIARRCGLFQPGSSTAEASGKRSHLEIVPSFAADVSAQGAATAMASLYANAAFRRHLEARGRARMMELAAAA
jgi:Phosphoenolpyruvate carboxylase